MPFYEFEGKRPVVGPETYIHPAAVLIGDVTVGSGCYLGAGAVLRGDFGRIVVGDGSNVQENAVLHASPMTPVEVEDGVIIGHGALLHDCAIKKGAIVGMGAVILHRAVVEEEAMVGAGAVVAPGFVVPARKIALGNPAQAQKDVSEKMLQMNKLGLAAYQELPARYLKGAREIKI
ncbi:MAG: gamma carbonic anhydrase family protein [Pseudomonadota bacterium]